MTPEQFAALAQLTHMRGGPAQESTRLVLVDGITQAEAGRRTGLTDQGVSNAVTRARKAMTLAQIAAHQPTDF
jgi:DNA-directed RNA polymerase specialized sigma24 family protein